VRFVEVIEDIARARSVLPETGVSLLAAGSSDGVVFPMERVCAGDESPFLHHIAHTIATALAGHPQLDAQGFDDWLRFRHTQIEEQKLCYIVHQLDVLGHCPSRGARQGRPRAGRAVALSPRWLSRCFELNCLS
jgi:hypothetical protein